MKQIDITGIQTELQNILDEYPTYSDFINDRKTNYNYMKKFKIKVCPYCNIGYIYVVEKGNTYFCRGDFDHFAKKSTNPELALDAENLIPSCLTCNERLKNQKDFSEETHIHPFKKDFDSIVKFNIDLISPNYLNEDNFNLKLVKKPEAKEEDFTLAKGNIKDFALEERYSYHKDTACEILKLGKYYYASKRKEINNLFGGENNNYILSKLLEYKNIDINNNSLGKLKKDITEKILRAL